MLPCLPTRGNIVAETKFPEKQKCFLANSETFDVSLCFLLMFPSACPLWETWRNIDRKQCFLVCPGLKARRVLLQCCCSKLRRGLLKLVFCWSPSSFPGLLGCLQRWHPCCNRMKLQHTEKVQWFQTELKHSSEVKL
jgi:hypothetical protein